MHTKLVTTALQRQQVVWRLALQARYMLINPDSSDPLPVGQAAEFSLFIPIRHDVFRPTQVPSGISTDVAFITAYRWFKDTENKIPAHLVAVPNAQQTVAAMTQLLSPQLLKNWGNWLTFDIRYCVEEDGHWEITGRYKQLTVQGDPQLFMHAVRASVLIVGVMCVYPYLVTEEMADDRYYRWAQRANMPVDPVEGDELAT
jgi:hypothetical protein